MGDYADAAIECFGPRLRDRLVPLLSPFRYELIEEPEHLIATIENLACGGEELLCDRLRELLIPHEFLHAGDHETEPRLRLFHPEVPEAFGDGAALGEWRGAASANGEALMASSSLDRILAEMPEDADDVWLREQLEIASAARWRGVFADLRGRPNTLRPRLVTRRLVDELPRILGSDSTFPYVRAHERYLVVLAVTYDHDDDPTDTGERVGSARDAAHWALELTRDGGATDTLWSVFDMATHTWSVLEQVAIEEA